MNREPTSPVWPSAPPPAAEQGLTWSLDHVSQLPRVRAQLRRHLAEGRSEDPTPESTDLDDQLVLAFDEMASNALRHGGGGVVARVAPHGASWLVEVCDEAPVSPPTPAVDRDPSQGGLGLHLIAEMATAHGWHTHGRAKSVWALLPR
ncbi:Histidine kinase-like ATPase domain-containing protein [Klenkia marina]|uniref:Histidine kinase-like ATPase domain-containing protein n=1 Tax=Klenkia marina TaxID=1960309 RepID=A0A1G4YY41_9ACTN|nr:ATP-binding protein [Klenkia marina]SCX58377.1 Histidine kinase-like ATPase domain-containing protein [Klenkia marina]